jgi:type I restriction enzyme S subunit
MKWPRVPLGSLKSGDRYSFVGGPFGSELTTRDYVSEGIPVIRGNNLATRRKFHDDDFVFVSDQKARQLESNMAHPCDLIFTQRGTLGQVGLIPKDARFKRYVVSQSQMKITVDEEKASHLFLYHYFRLPTTIREIINKVSSSGVPHINLGTLKAFEVPLPPLEVQSAIAAVAESYDCLIENNRRRIRLLEDAARLLFSEWFVDFRYPGHEHAQFVNGLPEGWTRKSLRELCKSVDYGYTASAIADPVGPKFLRITDIVPDQIDWSDVPHCVVPDAQMPRFSLAEGDIVVARTGATVGYAKRLHKRFPASVFASYLVRLRLGPDLDSLIAGVFVESDTYKKYVLSRVGGAAQPNANAQVLAGAEIVVPPVPIQRTFRALTEPLFDLKEILQDQSRRAREARDLLLPKLISGEVEV